MSGYLRWEATFIDRRSALRSALAAISLVDVPESDLSDEELTALALAADPSAPMDPEAVPMDVYLGSLGPVASPLLPIWYMAPIAGRRVGRRGRIVVLAVIAAFLLIEAFGLCSTYGQIPFH